MPAVSDKAGKTETYGQRSKGDILANGLLRRAMPAASDKVSRRDLPGMAQQGLFPG
jgi:hypothetical protein